MRVTTSLVAILILGLGSGCMPVLPEVVAPAATSPTRGGADAGAAKDYDPLIEGAEWHYRSTSGEATTEVTTRTFNVQASGDVTTAETETTSKHPDTGKVTTFKGTIKRMTDRSESTDTATGVTTVLKLPLTVGRTWTSGSYVFKVEGHEAVTVPYGEFASALKVTRRKGTSVMTLWMVDHVGTVKLSGPAERGGTVVMELVSFKKPSEQ